MRAHYLLAFIALAICGSSLALDYQPISAYSEGTALNIWAFGQTSSAQLNAGRAYAPVVEVVAANNQGPDGSSGEYQPLKCPVNGTLTTCPDVVRFCYFHAPTFSLEPPFTAKFVARGEFSCLLEEGAHRKAFKPTISRAPF